MRAYLIDPEKKEVTEVEYDGNYKTIYKLIQADLFDAVRMENGDTIFVDDEGLLKSPEYFFFLVGENFISMPLAGRGLVLGSNEEGDSIEPVVSIETVREMVGFVSRNDVRKSFVQGAYQ